MNEVKWIKIVTDIFDDEKILLIESLPSADSIIVIWFKLLCLAGKNNNNGVFILNNKIAYTDEMLATIFRRDINTVRLAINTFEEFGMIEIVEGVITIPNWGKHQNLDGMEKVREQTRQRVASYRAKQKQIAQKDCNVTSNVSVTQCNETDIDKEKEEDKEKDKRKDKSKTGFLKHSKQDEFKVDGLIDLYINTCTKLPKVRAMTDARKSNAEKIYKKYGLDAIKEVFEIANNSPFLTGDNDRGWKASFDFIMREDKFVAILEGKYNSKRKKQDKFADEGLATCLTRKGPRKEIDKNVKRKTY